MPSLITQREESLYPWSACDQLPWGPSNALGIKLCCILATNDAEAVPGSVGKGDWQVVLSIPHLSLACYAVWGWRLTSFQCTKAAMLCSFRERRGDLAHWIDSGPLRSD